MSKDFSRIHLWIVWALLLCSVGAVGVLWMVHVKSLASVDSANREFNTCRASLLGLQKKHVETTEKLANCTHHAQSLQAEKDKLSENLSLEKAMPRGSLGEFYKEYDRFAASLRFTVKLQVEYQISWKLEEDVSDEKIQGEGDESKVLLSAMGKSSFLQGLYLGRRSNFAFGMVAIADDDISLRVPSSQNAFKPPPSMLIKRKMWLDKEVKYIPDNPHIQRLLHVSISHMGIKGLASAISARVVRAWREQDRGYSVLVIGTKEATDGVDPGPPYVSEQTWLSSLDELGLFPMSCANGGLVLYKERLSVSYTKDRRKLPEINSSMDYYRNGWLRPNWDSIPGVLCVLFASLPSGEQETISPQIHSLVFPMIDRKSFWVPFWSVRERLLAPGKLDLTLIPAFDLESQRLPLVMPALPTSDAARWDESIFQSALYDLLKRKASAEH